MTIIVQTLDEVPEFLGTSLINKVATQLLDPDNVRWTRKELLSWLNDGQRRIVLMQPNLSSVTAAVHMQPGTRQALPADGWMLLDVYRNLGVNGTTPGRAVRIVSRQLMDAQVPNWHSAPSSSAVQNYIYDIQDQTNFYVYPPSDGNNYLEVNYSQAPLDLDTEASPLSLRLVFIPVLMDYMLYCACSKDAEYAPGLALAKQYWDAFTTSLGVKDKSDAANNVNQTLAPKNQPMAGATS